MLLPISRTRRRGNATRILRVSVATGTAVLAFTGSIACDSDDRSDSATTSTTTTATHSGHDHVTAPPSAQELQATLDGLVDPAKSVADKQKLVEDGEKRTSNIETMNQGLADYGTITFTVSDVQVEGEKATAQVVVTSPHGALPAMPMTWEHDDNRWELTDSDACRIFAMGRAPCQ